MEVPVRHVCTFPWQEDNKCPQGWPAFRQLFVTLSRRGSRLACPPVLLLTLVLLPATMNRRLNT